MRMGEKPSRLQAETSSQLKLNIEESQTLNREPIEENFDDLEDSSGKGGNKPETKEHLEALKSS